MLIKDSQKSVFTRINHFLVSRRRLIQLGLLIAGIIIVLSGALYYLVNYTNLFIEEYKPRQLIIDIKHNDFQRLAYKRQQALKRKIIVTEEDSYVPIRISADSQMYKAKMRLKGDYTDHLEGHKWSYRIIIKGNNAIWGMKRFSIQDPKRSNYANEWIFHQFLKHEGLIALRYDFINVIINGKDYGIYALEESFAKELVENNQRTEGPLLKFDEKHLIDDTSVSRGDKESEADIYFAADILSFDTARTLENKGLHSKYLVARGLIDDLRSAKKPVSQVFDIEKTARLFAVLQILSGYHAFRWKNIRFYFNPTTQKIEPIAYNLNGPPQGPDEFITMNRLFYQYWKRGSLEERHVVQWIAAFFSDPDFLKLYFGELERISAKGYLESFFAKIRTQLEKKQAIIHIDQPDARVLIDGYLANRNIVHEILHQRLPLKAYLKGANLSDNSLSIIVANTGFLPIEIISLECSLRKKHFSPAGNRLVAGKLASQALGHHQVTFSGFSKHDQVCIDTHERRQDNIACKHLNLVYQVMGTGNIRQTSVQTHPIAIDSFLLPPKNELIESLRQHIEKGLIKVDPAQRKIYLSPGTWTIESDLLIPPDYALIGRGNTSLSLNKNAAIISYSPVSLQGEPLSPLIIKSDDHSGQGLVVISAKQASKLTYVNISDQGAIDRGGWRLRGAVTIYGSEIVLQNVWFEGGRAEDQLNIIRSKFSISDSVFTKSRSDALDVDFGQGNITRTRFINCGNDCLDVSGTVAEIKSISVDTAQDKGISIGENSKVSIKDGLISKTDMAVASKDSSTTEADNLQIFDSKIGYTAYRKKPEFSGGVLHARKTKMHRVAIPFRVDGASTITNDDTTIPKGTGVK
jgi:hypothetical protein